MIPFGNTFRLIASVELSSLKPQEQVLLAILLSEAQKRQLFIDAASANDRYYHGRKVVDALERSLSKLNETLPGLSEYAHNRSSFQANLNN